MKDLRGNRMWLDGREVTCDEGELATAGFQHAYEVIRVIDGLPLFLKDHMIRLESSARVAGIYSAQFTMIAAENIRNAILALGEKNFNIKLVAWKSGSDEHMLIYPSVFHYPTQEMVRSGVRTCSLPLERQNPNAKIWDENYKQTVNRLMADKQMFEVLLIDRDGDFTEGSRSNLFFVRNGQLITAPESMVLKGITRQYVLEAAKRCGINILEQPLRKEELSTIDAVFISGTSLKIQPVCEIDGEFWPADHPILVRLIEEFNAIVIENLR